MTIDEAIKHCNEVASGALCESTANHKACGEEHKQLAGWLEELKRMRTKFLTKKTVEGLEIDEEPKCSNCGEELSECYGQLYCPNCVKLYRWGHVEEEDKQ